MGLAQVEPLTERYSEDDVSELVAVTGSTRLSSPAAVLRWGQVSPADLELWMRSSWADNLRREFRTRRISSIRGEDTLPVVPLAEHLVVRDLDIIRPRAEQVSSSHGKIVGHAHYRFWPSYGALQEAHDGKDDLKKASISIPPGFDQALSNRIKIVVDATMLKLFNGLPCFELENISTLTPSHLRRGIAKSLTEWIFPHADRLGLPIILSASPMGLPLYKKCGFVEYRDYDVVVELAEWGGEGVHRLVAMVRWPRQIQRLPESWTDWRVAHTAQSAVESSLDPSSEA